MIISRRTLSAGWLAGVFSLAILLCTELPAEDLDLPAASGSFGANLANGPDGQPLLSWLEPDGDGHALRYAEFIDGRWSAAQTVARGDHWFVNWADFPSVVPVSGDFWTAHWLVRRPAGGYAYDINVAVSNDAGKTWSEAGPAHADDTNTEHGFVSTFAHDGGAGLVWLDGRGTQRAAAAGLPPGMTLRTAVLTPAGELRDGQELDPLICDCCQTDVTLSSAGPVAAYRNRTPDEVRDIFIARQVDDEWLPGVAVADDGWVIEGCPVNGPAIASRGNEVAVAWFTAADDRPRVRLARTPDAGSAFSAPVDLFAGNAVGRVGLALLDDGSAAVSALQRTGPGRASLQLTVVDADGSVHAPLTIADDLPSFSVPQLLHAGDALMLVWTTSTDGKTELRAKRVPLATL